MKRRYELIAVSVIIILAVVIIFVTTYNLLYKNVGNQNTSIDSAFIQEPVVDVIVPSIFKQGSSGGIDSPLNLTQGQTTSLQVDVYSTVVLNASMSFRAIPLSISSGSTDSLSSNHSGNFTWIFEPTQLQIAANGKANTTLLLTVPYGFAPGTYSAVITAANLRNTSQSWGNIFQVNISK